MAVVSMKSLLESGVHFGHRTNKWHPKMKSFIFTERNGIHIIDLQQTVKAINTVYTLLRDKVAEGGIVLFVGTKRQAQETVQEEATRCGMPYVTERWLGGMLTNWSTMFQRIKEMERMEKLLEDFESGNLTKKEGLLIQRKVNRLHLRLSGVRDMIRTPDMLFVVDVSREASAVHEANLLNIPVIALVDTNCDPSNVDHVIPSNDDAIRAIKLLVGKMADAVLEGKALRKEEERAAEELEKAEVSEDEEKAPVHAIEEEEEFEDEDLLGEATLAKLGPARKAEEDGEEDEEDKEDVEEESKKEKDKIERKERKKKEEEIKAADKISEAIPEEPEPAQEQSDDEPKSEEEDSKEEKKVKKSQKDKKAK